MGINSNSVARTPLLTTLLAGPSTSLRDDLVRCLVLRDPMRVAIVYDVEPGGLVRRVVDAGGEQARERLEACCLSCAVPEDAAPALELVAAADNQLQPFARLLNAISRAGLAMTWNKRYRRGQYVREDQFHDDLHAALKADPVLEGRVERGTALGHGYLDTRHDGITAELEVARDQPATPESATKYIGQPTQYAAADGARLSSLVVLDMSRKVLPIGTPENYLFVVGPKQHGMTDPHSPSVVVTLVINGNLPVPSSWSRRKTPTTETL